jgi:hypothetical protein
MFDLATLLAILHIAFANALAIVRSDGWFAGKTNMSHPRFINLTTGKKSITAEPGFTQVDIDAMNAIPDRSMLTPELLNQNPGLLAAFAFSVMCNMSVFDKFREIITYLRGNGIDIESMSAMRKVFIAHLAWALANIADKPAWSNISYDPLIKAILSVNDKLPLPRFEDASHDDSAYFAAFVKAVKDNTDAQIADGLHMDADRFEFYFRTMN